MNDAVYRADDIAARWPGVDRLLVARILASSGRHPADVRAALVLPINDDWSPPTPTVVAERRQRNSTRQRAADDSQQHVDTDQRLHDYQYTSYNVDTRIMWFFISLLTFYSPTNEYRKSSNKRPRRLFEQSANTPRRLKNRDPAFIRRFTVLGQKDKCQGHRVKNAKGDQVAGVSS